jgi:hypothetical protein
MPNTECVDQRSYGPIPIFVEQKDYLGSADFVSAQLIEHEGEPIVSLKLTPNAQEKINHLASVNAQAQELEDYVHLVRCHNGKLADALTFVNNPIPGYEMWIGHMPKSEAASLVAAIGREIAP